MRHSPANLAGNAGLEVLSVAEVVALRVESSADVSTPKSLSPNTSEMLAPARSRIARTPK
jgi:hypothetical protein